VHDIAGMFGSVYHTSHKTDTIIVTGLGNHSIHRGPEAEARSQERLTEGIRQIAAYHGAPVWVAHKCHSRPLDIADLRYRWGEQLHPDVISAGASLGEQTPDMKALMLKSPEVRMYAFAQARLETFEQNCDQSTMAMLMTIPRDRELHDLMKGKTKLGSGALQNLNLVRMAEMFREAVESSGVEGTELLSNEEAKEFIRECWDVSRIGAYHLERLNNRLGFSESTNGHSGQFHWPHELMQAGPNYVEIEGTLHAILAVTSKPGQDHPYTWLKVMATQWPWFSFVLCGEVDRTKEDYRFLKLEEEGKKTLQRIRYDQFDLPYHIEQGNEELRQKKENIYDAEYKHGYDALLTVSCDARTPELLDIGAAEVLKAVRGSGMDAWRIEGELTLKNWAMTALTGIPL
jgi:hypothetical protein